jgi:hypothetical protein
MPNLPKILPCPFCGETPGHVSRNRRTAMAVHCQCNSRGPIIHCPSKIAGLVMAIEAWNKRGGK